HSEFRLARRVVLERQRQPVKLRDEFRCEPVFQLLDGILVDLLQPGPALLVKRSGLALLEQLPDHRADPHHLGGLLDHLRDRPLGQIAVSVFAATADRDPVGSDDDDLRPARLLWAGFVAHASTLSGCRGYLARKTSFPVWADSAMIRCARAASCIG